jgi:hypothetical protein
VYVYMYVCMYLYTYIHTYIIYVYCTVALGTIQVPPVMRGTVLGVASLNNEVYVLRSGLFESEIVIYDGFTLEGVLSIPGLRDATDIVSCRHNQCLYLPCGRVVLRVEKNPNSLGYKIVQWIFNDEPTCGLSVTAESNNILVASCNSRTLKVFTPHGALIREICLQSDLANLYHAVELATGQFAVCYKSDSLHCVSIVDADGRIALTYKGSKWFTASATRRYRIAVDKTGYIFVADPQNKRVLAMDSKLANVRDIVSCDQGLDGELKLYLNAENDRLYVTNNDNVKVFQILRKKLQSPRKKLAEIADIVKISIALGVVLFLWFLADLFIYFILFIYVFVKST